MKVAKKRLKLFMDVCRKSEGLSMLPLFFNSEFIQNDCINDFHENTDRTQINQYIFKTL